MEDIVDLREHSEGVNNDASASFSQYGQFYNPTRQQLKKLVMSYLCHQCYLSTAEVFVKSKDIQSRLEDAERRRSRKDDDGDETMGSGAGLLPDSSGGLSKETVVLISLSRDIKDCLLNGKIDEARQLLNRHFPSVLNATTLNSSTDIGLESTTTPATGLMLSPSNPPMADNNSCRVSLKPEHLNLNLRIQSFIEAVRTKPLSPSSSDVSSPDSSTSSPPTKPLATNPKKALALAQKLYMEVSSIESPKDRNDYMQEVNNVGGLMAYKVPEQSPISTYLSMKRREAVAEQINSAIMVSIGRTPTSFLQRYVEHNTVLWSMLDELSVTTPPPSNAPPGVALPSSTVSSHFNPSKGIRVSTPGFELARFLAT